MNPADNALLFDAFCDHMCANLCVLDFIYKTKQLKDPGFDADRDDPLILSIQNETIVGRFSQINYISLLERVVKKLHILESCSDVFRSEMDDELISLFSRIIDNHKKQVKIKQDPRGLIVHCSAFISDLILPVLSRLHSEVILNFKHFLSMIDAVGGNPNELFLNAKSPSPTSQFIQMWVSNELGIPHSIQDRTFLVVS